MNRLNDPCSRSSRLSSQLNPSTRSYPSQSQSHRSIDDFHLPPSGGSIFPLSLSRPLSVSFYEDPLRLHKTPLPIHKLLHQVSSRGILLLQCRFRSDNPFRACLDFAQFALDPKRNVALIQRVIGGYPLNVFRLPRTNGLDSGLTSELWQYNKRNNVEFHNNISPDLFKFLLEKLRHTSLNKGSTVSSCITHSSGQFCATILSIHLPPSGQTASLNHIFVLYNPNTGFEHPNTPAFAFFSTAGGVASYVYRQIQTKQTLRSPDRTTSGSYNFRIYTHSTTNPTLPQTFIDDTLVPITPCNQYMLSDDPWQAVFTELRDRGRDKRSSSSSADSLRQSLAAQRDLLDYILFSRFLHLPSSNTNPADTDIPPPVPPKRPIPSGPPFKCPICLDDEPGSNAIEIVGCGHKFGIGCLRLLVKSALRDKKFPVVCPSCSVEDERSDGVVGMITSHTAQKIGISSKEFAFCEELELASVAVALHCTKCGRTAHVDRDDYHAQMDCLAEIPVEEPRKRKRQVIAAWLKKKLWKTDKTKKFEVPDECSIQRCVFPECDHLWCKHCSQTLLENTPHTCDGTAELARLMATEGWKNCPGCRVPIEKTFGCNHMTCSTPGCNTHFCYVCGKAIVRSAFRPLISSAIRGHFRSTRGCVMYPYD